MTNMQHGPLVRLKDGAVRGKAQSGVLAFLGIPYAAPPFGANRMRPPRPAQPWDGERDATAYGPTAPKGDYPPAFGTLFPEVTIPGEDCLNLNVWTPDPGAAGLPVLVWIHGGSFMNGSGSVGEYDGSSFARDGVVCVTVNYRLGGEGFLFLADGHANLGLLDQLAALRWVQDNISAFGGDPGRVTVAGESAGAMSVATLLSMPLAEGLFGRAIAQSGAASHTLTRAEALMAGGYLADTLDVPAELDPVRAIPPGTLARAASGLVSDLQTSPPDPDRWGRIALTLLPFGPVADGTVVPRDPLAAIEAGHGGDVPLLIGTNRDEARLFFVAPGSIDLIDDATLGAAAAGYGLSPAALDRYRAGRPGASAGDILAAVFTDWCYRVPAIRVAEARAGRGTGSTWMYRFDHLAPGDNGRLGSCHAAEIPFVFGTAGRDDVRPRIGDAPSSAATGTAHRTWVRFIVDGDPGWAAYDTGRRTTGLLADGVSAVDDPDAGERAAWDGVR